MGKEAKTNAMRILERAKVPYTAHEYAHEEGVAVDGVTVAKSMGFDPAQVFKTLVARGASGQYYVFLPTVIVSAGKIGYQVEVKPADLMGLVRAETADIIVE